VEKYGCWPGGSAKAKTDSVVGPFLLSVALVQLEYIAGEGCTQEMIPIAPTRAQCRTRTWAWRRKKSWLLLAGLALGDTVEREDALGTCEF
jgi:hypothetical protein